MTKFMTKHGMFMAALVMLSGFVWPSQAQARGDVYCREYTESIRISGKWEDGYGTVCLQEDESWKIVVGATPENRNDKRDYDRHYNAPVRTVVYEYRRPRVIYVYDSSPRRFTPPGHVKHYYKQHYKHHHKHHGGHGHH